MRRIAGVPSVEEMEEKLRATSRGDELQAALSPTARAASARQRGAAFNSSPPTQAPERPFTGPQLSPPTSVPGLTVDQQIGIQQAMRDRERGGFSSIYTRWQDKNLNKSFREAFPALQQQEAMANEKAQKELEQRAAVLMSFNIPEETAYALAAQTDGGDLKDYQDYNEQERERQARAAWVKENPELVAGMTAEQVSSFIATNELPSGIKIDNRTMGPIPEGHEVVYDDKGRVLRMDRIPNSPADLEFRDLAMQNMRRDQRYIQANENQLLALDDVLNKVSGLNAGFGSLLAFVPESEALDIKGAFTKILAQEGFKTLTHLRDNKTGGALGNVSNKELEFLQNAYQDLKQAQDPEDIKDAVKNLMEGTMRANYLLIFEDSFEGKSNFEIRREVNGYINNVNATFALQALGASDSLETIQKDIQEAVWSGDKERIDRAQERYYKTLDKVEEQKRKEMGREFGAKEKAMFKAARNMSFEGQMLMSPFEITEQYTKALDYKNRQQER